MFTKSKLLLSLSLLFTTSSFAQTAPDSSPVEQLSEFNIVYPASEESSGNDAWVRVNFIVNKDGVPEDILVQDAFGGKAFEDAAIAAINQARFKPATYKGKNVEQNIANMVINITSSKRDEANPVDQDFVTSYTQAADLIKQDKYDEAEAVIDALTARGNFSLEEIARAEVLRAQFAAKKGDALGTLKHLRNAKIGNGIFLPESQLIDVIRSHSSIALQNSLFYEAFESQELLERIAPENELVTRLALTTAPIRKAIQEGRPIKILAKLDERGQWVYRPLHSNFSFNAVTEGVKSFQPRCDRSNKTFPVATGKEWRIPKSWGYCTVVISGEPGAAFEFMEYPDAEEAGS